MEVTQAVFKQYREIQRSGEVNMVNKGGVKRVAVEHGHHDLLAFIDEGDYYGDLLKHYSEYRERFEER